MNEQPAIRVPWCVYVVETDPTRAYGGLHDVTAQHVICQQPGPGDRIVLALEGHVDYVLLDGYRHAIAAFLHVPRGYVVETHAGRSAMLGEDGLEDAYGQDALAALVPELLGAGCSWRYAPVELVPEDENAQHRYGRYWKWSDEAGALLEQVRKRATEEV